MYFEDVHDAVVVDPQAFGEHVIGQLFCPAGADGFTTLVISKKDNYLFRQSSLKKVRCAFACPLLLCMSSVSLSSNR
jgi:hypothetical protein